MRNGLLKSFALVALFAAVFAGCKEDEPTYMVQVTATEGGTIEGQNAEYKEGETVVFTAKPNDGYYFAGWSDGKTDNPRTIIIGNQDISLAALFFAPTVNLGLESGTLWATCNIGAAKPWEYGDYYAWGETKTKSVYYWDTYKYCNGDYYLLTKYCYNASYGSGGFTDTLTTLEATDDVATVVLDSDYSMPTAADWEELDRECYWVRTNNYNGTYVEGYIVYKAKSAGDKGTKVYSDRTPSASYSMSDAHIFLPAAGSRYHDYLNGSYGEYWSSSLSGYAPDLARYCYFLSNNVHTSGYSEFRCHGLSIRPVRRK